MPADLQETSASVARASQSQVHKMYEQLSECYPDAHCELNHRNPFELLVATVLSAQTTDQRVNSVTEELFRRWPDARHFAAAPIDQVEQVLRPLGFWHTKSAAVVDLSAILVEEWDGEVPADLHALTRLPGVGRKTANVVLGNAFGIPGITPDTHVQRVTRRMGWTSATTARGVENQLAELFGPSQWVLLCHRLIWHGRRCCRARRPACGTCPVARACPSFGVGPTDPSQSQGPIK